MRTAGTAPKGANTAVEIGKAALISLVISFILVVLYAVALKEELLETATMPVFTTVIKIICAASAGIVSTRRRKSRLWLVGAAAGAVYTLLAFGVFSAVAGSFSVSLALLFDLFMGALAGLLSVMTLQAFK